MLRSPPCEERSGGLGKDGGALYFFFYYPTGVEAEREGLPWLTGALIACMVGLFAWFQTHPLQALLSWRWWVYFPQEGVTPGMLLSVLNHANWVHLLGNLIYLWVFGPSLEQALGRFRFLLLFFFLGLFGNLIQGAIAQHWLTAFHGYGILGASGAISGLMGLFVLRYPHARIRTAWLIFSPLHGQMRSGIIGLSSRMAIVSWILFQLIAIGTNLLALGGDSTAYGAHFGGLLAGILAGLGLGLQREGASFQRRHEAEQRFARGDWMGAFEAVQPLLESEAPEEITLAARACRLVGNDRQALGLYRRSIRNALAQGDELGGAACYAEALRLYPGLFFEEETQFKLILALGHLQQPAAALHAIHSFRTLYPRSPRLSLLLLRAARLEESIDPDCARDLYAEQLERFPGSPYEGVVRRALRDLA